MKVYVVQDLATNTIIGIYSTFRGAQKEFELDPDARICKDYDVIDVDTKFKSIVDTNEKVYEPKHMDSYMPFGKYQGKRIDELIEEDPKYIKWATENLNFAIDEECQEFLEEMIAVK